MSEFVAQTLNSRDLLALLFVLESKRKGNPVSPESFQQSRPEAWDELLSIFADRFSNLSETMRFEVLEAHLMSVEDLDVYHNETLQDLLDTNRPALDALTSALGQDPRFRLDA